MALSALGAVVLLTGSTLNVSDHVLPKTLNPLLAKWDAEVRVGELIFDRLVLPSATPGTYHSHVLVETGGALKTELSDDGTAVKLWVREGIRWHDGESFGADDVCFTIDTLLDPEQASPLAPPIRKALSSCEATDDTVTLRYRRAIARPLAVLDVPVLPRHVLEGVVSLRDHAFSTRPVGTGPMSAVLGPRQVTLTAFPNSHHSPKIEQVVVREVHYIHIALREMSEGTSHGFLGRSEHLVWSQPTWDEFTEMKDREGLVMVPTHGAPSIVYLTLNTNQGPLTHTRLREAVYRNLDVRALAMTTYEGRAEPAVGSLPPLFHGGDPLASSPPRASPSLPPPSVALGMTDAGARRELQRTKPYGATEFPEHWVWQDGKPAWLEVVCIGHVAGNMDRPLTRQLRAADLPFRGDRPISKLGYLGPNRERLQGIDMVIAEWSLPATGDLSAVLHTPGPNGQGADNLLHYSNPEVDALLEKRDAARTEEELNSANKAVLELITEDRSHIFLWQPTPFGVWRSEVNQVHTTPGHFFTEFDQWTVEEAATPEEEALSS